MISSFIITALRLLGAVFLTKIVYLYYGSEGLIISGVLVNIVQVMFAIFSCGMSTSLVTITAKLNNDEKYKPFSLLILICLAVFTLFLIVSFFFDSLGYERLNIFGFHTDNIYHITVISFLFSIKMIYFSTLNGLRKMRWLALFTFIDTLTLPLFICILSSYNISYDYVYLCYLFFVVLSLQILYPCNVLRVCFKDCLDVKGSMKPYMAMTIISTIITPITLLIIRNLSERSYGIDVTGAIQGSWRLGDALLSAATGILGLYYLPKFSAKSIDQVKLSIMNILPFLIIFGVFGYGFYFLISDYIIKIFLGLDFLEYSILFNVHILAVSLRIISYYLGLFMVSHGLSRFFIFHEIIVNATYIVLVLFVTTLSLSYIYVPLSFLSVSFLSLLITLYFFIKASDGKGKTGIFNSNTAI
ncbi:hypothetical protein RDG66_12895 [Vibrio cholerae]